MDIEKLQLKLKKGNPKQRFEAIGELVKLDSTEVLPILQQSLKIEDHNRVIERLNKAILYLETKPESSKETVNPGEYVEKSDIFGSGVEVPNQPNDLAENTISKLKKALNSKNEASEMKAMRFILKNCATQLVPYMIDIALKRDDTQFKLKTLEILRLLNRSEFSSDLIDFLKVEDILIIKASLEVLDSLGHLPDVLSMIKEFTNSEDQELAKTADNYLEKLIDQGNKEAIEFFSELKISRERKAKEEAFEPFVPEGMEDLLPKKMTDALDEQKRQKSAKQKQAVLAFKYKSQMESKDPKQRIDAMFQLAKANDPEAIELITQLLSNESDFKVIASGLSALAQMNADAALAAIQNFLSHEDDRVRANAVSSIDKILGDEKPKPMLERMLKDPNHRVRANAISALLLKKPKECFLPLHALVNSDSKDEKVAAIVIIERFQQDTHLIMLEKFMHSDDSRVVEKTRSVLENWQGDIELSKYILSGGQEFQQFYTKHLEKKRHELNRQEDKSDKEDKKDNDGKSPAEPQIEELMQDSEEESGLLSNLLKKFRF